MESTRELELIKHIAIQQTNLNTMIQINITLLLGICFAVAYYLWY